MNVIGHWQNHRIILIPKTLLINEICTLQQRLESELGASQRKNNQYYTKDNNLVHYYHYHLRRNI